MLRGLVASLVLLLKLASDSVRDDDLSVTSGTSRRPSAPFFKRVF